MVAGRSTSARELAAAAMSFTMSGHAICGSVPARPDLLGARGGRAGPAARERMGPQARRADRGTAFVGRIPRFRLRRERRPAAPALERLERFQALPGGSRWAARGLFRIR